MAKFIELPYGAYSKDLNTQERKAALVNVDGIIKIQPDGDYACRVTLRGGNQLIAYRRFDTLSAQLRGGADINATYPDEEIAAAFDAGYAKAKSEINPDLSRKQLVKEVVALAAQWLETNPISTGWQTKMRKDIKAAMDGDITEE